MGIGNGYGIVDIAIYLRKYDTIWKKAIPSVKLSRKYRLEFVHMEVRSRKSQV